MNQLVQNRDGEPVTTSLIVAEQTGNHHKNILEMVDKYLADFSGFGLVAFETRPRPAGQHGGGTVRYAVLNEQQTTLLITYLRNSERVREFKKLIVAEFFEMRRRLSTPVQELTFAEKTLEVLSGLQKMVEAKDQQIAVLEPKADAWDSIISSKGSWSFNEAAKFLHEHKCISIGEHRLFDRCVEWGYLYRDHKGRPCAYQKYIEQGLFVEKAKYYRDQVTGEMKTGSAPQVRVTSKGLDKLHRQLTVGQLELVV